MKKNVNPAEKCLEVSRGNLKELQKIQCLIAMFSLKLYADKNKNFSTHSRKIGIVKFSSFARLHAHKRVQTIQTHTPKTTNTHTIVNPNTKIELFKIFDCFSLINVHQPAFNLS